MFRFSEEPISGDELRAKLADPRAGAIVTFEGLVRNHNEGREVLALTYEAYQSLAIMEAERIIAGTKERFAVYSVHCVHRVGNLSIGDLAVWVGVSAAHRGTAFGACQAVIDEIKARLPIWKKETYRDGSSGWVNCQTCASASEAGGDAGAQQRLQGPCDQQGRNEQRTREALAKESWLAAEGAS